MATICVPNRDIVTCVVKGVASRMRAECQRPVKPGVHPCDYVLCPPEPEVTDLVSGMGYASVMGTIAAAGGNPDEIVWDLLNRLTGAGSVEYFRGLFGTDPERIPGCVSEGDPGYNGVESGWVHSDARGSRVITAFGRGWARGQLDQAYNAALAAGGTAQTGVAGIVGESKAADRGEKSFPDWPDEFYPPDDPESPYRDPREGFCDIVPCTDEEVKSATWGSPDGPAKPDRSMPLTLPIPKPDIFKSPAWHRVNQGGLLDNGRGLERLFVRVSVGGVGGNQSGPGPDFSVACPVRIGGMN